MDKTIKILDGGFGTMVQSYNLSEDDFRGSEFASWPVPLKGCNDLLVLTRPDVVADIHGKYLMAGADIITTDTFNANRLSLADYRLDDYSRQISLAAALTARTVADQFTRRNPSKPRFVSGSVGPTSKSLSIAADMDNPDLRPVTFEQMAAAFEEQISGLVEGGVDFVQLETQYDALNTKAAIVAAERVFESLARRVPIIISGTLTQSGRTLSGQTIEAFYTSVEHARPWAVGLNCGFGAEQLMPYVERLGNLASMRITAYPNAGLPNAEGGYDETPETMAAHMEQYMRKGLVDIIGGCCGTTPAHIMHEATVAKSYTPRGAKQRDSRLALSGLERLEITKEKNFINIGERTNVAGSAAFARLIREQNYQEALAIARKQIEAGAQLIDVCFDDSMIDARQAMVRFLNMAAAEPDISKVPFMLDSSSWEVLEAGLQCVQGKSVVNSISLKEGEEEFVRRAKLIDRYGAAAVVMLFDEKGQADTFERKIEVAERAYNLLTNNGFRPENIIFDPNILAVATGIEQHDGYAKAFIDGCRWIKEHYPLVGLSGGVSNLSFAFRGNNTVRKAMHSVFLYHAIKAGMNMGIVNPAMTTLYDDIEPELREKVEDVILCRRADAADRLIALASHIHQTQQSPTTDQQTSTEQWLTLSTKERIEYALLHGIADRVAEDAVEALGQVCGKPIRVIDEMFMPAMETIGERFGQGRMFLPQVVKSARVMKTGVSALLPYMETGDPLQASDAKKILIATVKGDVHDIGKNIVAVVMSCNGYVINDLGVMVEPETIVSKAVEWGADAVGLSALITPSLDQMIAVAKLMEQNGLRIPLLVGGATTSALHTAVKIAPHYSGPTVYCRNASDNTYFLSRLFSPKSEEHIAQIQREQQQLRIRYALSQQGKTVLTPEQAAMMHETKSAEKIVKPIKTALFDVSDIALEELVDYIDWTFFFNSWEIKGHYPELLDHPERGAEARKLLADGKKMLDEMIANQTLKPTGRYGIVGAHRSGEQIVLEWEGKEYSLPCQRGLTPTSGYHSLTDYVACEGDYVGLFAVSAAVGLKEFCDSLRSESDDYGAIMAKLLADRLTEALTEVVFRKLRRGAWGYEKGNDNPDEVLKGNYQGRRMAFGYPSCPDHGLKRPVFELLDIENSTPMRLTENNMIVPGESECGLLFADKEIEYFSVN